MRTLKARLGGTPLGKNDMSEKTGMTLVIEGKTFICRTWGEIREVQKIWPVLRTSKLVVFGSLGSAIDEYFKLFRNRNIKIYVDGVEKATITVPADSHYEKVQKAAMERLSINAKQVATIAQGKTLVNFVLHDDTSLRVGDRVVPVKEAWSPPLPANKVFTVVSIGFNGTTNTVRVDGIDKEFPVSRFRKVL